MIVPSMTHAEVFRELEHDRENIGRWWMRQYDKNRRRALKTQKFPAIWWFDYTSPRHNRYIICAIVLGRKYENKHSIMTYALRKEDRGYTVYLTGINKNSIVHKSVFIQHVFDRYAQRAKVEKTGVELIKHMFSQQVGGHTLYNQKLAGRSVRYKGREHRFIVIKDGVLLGEYEENYFLLHSFITYDKASGLQKEEFDRAHDALPDWDEELKFIHTIQNSKENIITNTNVKKPKEVPYGWETPS